MKVLVAVALLLEAFGCRGAPATPSVPEETRVENAPRQPVAAQSTTPKRFAEPVAAPSASSATAPAAPPQPTQRIATGQASGSPALRSCEAPTLRRAIARELFLRQEFREYVCADEPCSLEAFAEGITFRQEVLREYPRTLGCIVGPLRESMTRIYGVMLLEEQVPKLLLVYLGIYIGVDPNARTSGFKDLVATERTAPDTWLTHRYVWQGGAYVRASTKRARDVP